MNNAVVIPTTHAERRAALHDTCLYLCTDTRSGRGDLADFLDAAFTGGVDIVQIREKGIEARAEIAALETLAEIAGRHGRWFAVNDRADVARAVGAPILHLGQDDLPVPLARELIGPDVLIGRSTHDTAQFDTALSDDGTDYLCAGPTWTTPTKPGRPAAGLALLEHAAAAVTAQSPPWFAIGGIDGSRLSEVQRAGARRIVVVRAITEAQDPEDAARQLVTALRR